MRAAVSDRLIDEYCLVGSAERCRDGLARWDDTAAATAVLVPHAVGPGEDYVAGVRRCLTALSPERA